MRLRQPFRIPRNAYDEMYEQTPEERKREWAEVRDPINVYPVQDGKVRRDLLDLLESIRHAPGGALLLKDDEEKRYARYVALASIREERGESPTPIIPVGYIVTRVSRGVAHLLHMGLDGRVQDPPVSTKLVRKVQKEAKKHRWEGLEACVSVDDPYTRSRLLSLAFQNAPDSIALGGEAHRLIWRPSFTQQTEKKR